MQPKRYHQPVPARSCQGFWLKPVALQQDPYGPNKNPPMGTEAGDDKPYWKALQASLGRSMLRVTGETGLIGLIGSGAELGTHEGLHG